MIVRALYQPAGRPKQEISEALVAIKASNLDEALRMIENDRYLLPHERIISAKEDKK